MEVKDEVLEGRKTRVLSPRPLPPSSACLNPPFPHESQSSYGSSGGPLGSESPNG